MYPRMLCRTDINYTRTIIKRFCRPGWRITGSDNWYLRHRPAVNRPELSVTDIVFDWLRAFRDSAGLCGLEHRVDTLKQSYLSIAPRYSDCPQSRVHGATHSQVHSSFVVWLLPWRHIQWDSLNLHNSSRNVGGSRGSPSPERLSPHRRNGVVNMTWKLQSIYRWVLRFHEHRW